MMDASQSTPPPRNRSRPGLTVAALAVLAALSLWAFTGNTDAVRTEAGVRVNPRDAYNPVAAGGEELPAMRLQDTNELAIASGKPGYQASVLRTEGFGTVAMGHQSYRCRSGSVTATVTATVTKQQPLSSYL